MWWLYSDQARSASVRGASGSSNGQRLVRRRRQRGPARRELSGHLGGRGAIGDDVDGRRQRGERRRREQHGDAHPELHLDEASQAQRGQRLARVEPTHRAVVERAQHQQPAEQDHLGHHHEPVGGADQGPRPVDVAQGQTHPGGHQHRHGDEGQRGEPLDDRRRRRRWSAAERDGEEAEQAADPGRGRHLVDRVERQQARAMVQARRRVARPGGADHHRQRAAQQQRPPRPHPGRAPHGQRGHDQHDGRQRASHRGPEILRGHQPRGERAGRRVEGTGQQRQHPGLGHRDDGRARRHQRPHPHQPGVARPGAENEEREEDSADRDGLAGQGQAAQDDVNESGHVSWRDRGRGARRLACRRSRPAETSARDRTPTAGRPRR